MAHAFRTALAIACLAILVPIVQLDLLFAPWIAQEMVYATLTPSVLVILAGQARDAT